MSAELERPVTGGHLAAERPAASPGTGTYVLVLVLVVLFTLVQVAVLNVGLLAGVRKPLIGALMVANFTLGALYYQGLQYENALNKIVFATGVGCAVVVILGLLTLLPLGR